MQYQFVGADQSGRLIYEPVVTQAPQSTIINTSYQFYDPDTDTSASQSLVREVKVEPTQPKRKSTSIFSKFFIIDDGVISISLKGMTFIFSGLISVALLTMLYISCTDGTFECSLTEFPMVSNVIALEMNTRIFLFLSAWFMFGVNQVNIRAFYKKIYGIVSDSYNDRLMYCGMASMITLPLIGIFDMHQWKLEHGFLAVTFFLSFGVYAYYLAKAMKDNIDKFPADENSSIQSLSRNAHGLAISLLLLGVSALLHGPTPLFEWITTLYYLNFFAILSYTNTFYDSVHQDGTLVASKQQ